MRFPCRGFTPLSLDTPAPVSLKTLGKSVKISAWQVGRCEEVQGVQEVLVRCTQEFCKMNQYF